MLSTFNSSLLCIVEPLCIYLSRQLISLLYSTVLFCSADLSNHSFQFLQAILSPVNVVSHTAAQIIAAYGAVDVEGGLWPSLLPTLLNNISNPEIPTKPKVSSLEVRTYMRMWLVPNWQYDGWSIHLMHMLSYAFATVAFFFVFAWR